MSLEEQNFNETFSPWEMVTGPSGTFLRTINLGYDLENWFGPEKGVCKSDLSTGVDDFFILRVEPQV